MWNYNLSDALYSYVYANLHSFSLMVYSFTLNMVVVYFSGELVATYLTARRHTPLDSNPHEHRLENMLQPPITNPVTLPV